MHTCLLAYACRIYSLRSGQVLDFEDIRLLIHSGCLVCGFCTSSQRFACGFLQIPPRDGHPCRPANISPCRVCNGLRGNLLVTIKQVRPAGRTKKKGRLYYAFPKVDKTKNRLYSPRYFLFFPLPISSSLFAASLFPKSLTASRCVKVDGRNLSRPVLCSIAYTDWLLTPSSLANPS